MKKGICFFSLCLVLIFFSYTVSFSQNTTENLLENVTLNFNLSGNPTPQAVGFDNSKSSWKLKYELLLTDSATLEKLGRCFRDAEYNLVCPINADKKLAKKIRKASMSIYKGRFKRNQLAVDANRDITVPVQLSANVIDIFNKSVSSDSNPTFVLIMEGKISTKTTDKIKFKKKSTASSRVYPLKFYRQDKTVEGFWNVKTIALSFSLNREGSVINGFGF